MSLCARCSRTFDGASECPFCVPGDSAVSAESWRPPLAVDRQLGQTVGGKFRITQLIGAGGMGRVYRARHVMLDKDVAIKVLREQGALSETEMRRFHREALAASRLRNEHTIQVLDFGFTDEGLPYFAMELVAGRDLTTLLQQEGPLTEERACHLGQQVLGALGEAHARHIIHRDLKPANIMIERRIDEPDFVKVLDFGLAKIQEAHFVSITRTDCVCGTPGYMSPEQGRGDELDPRSDLYSVGVILYELVTGVRPFEGRSAAEVLRRHQEESPIPLRVRRPGRCSSELEQLVLSALEKEPSLRPATAEQFREALVKLQTQHRRERERTIPSQKSVVPAPRVVEGRTEPGSVAREMELEAPTIQERPITEAAPVAPKRRFRIASTAFALGAIGAALLVWVRPPRPALPVAPVKAPPAGATAGPETSLAPLPSAPATTPPPALPPSRSDAAKRSALAARLVNGQAYPAYYQLQYSKAMQLFRSAIAADPEYAPAYQGLYLAGLGASDRSAILEGGRGYLRLKPHADDARLVQSTLHAQ